MTVYISKKSARKAAEKHLSQTVTHFAVKPFVQLFRDGSHAHGYRAALFNRFGTFVGWA